MILNQIVAKKREFVTKLPVLDSNVLVPSKRNFLAAIKEASFGVIAELKSASPSEGIIKADYNTVALAKEYVKGGAAAISVLTDEPFFNGSYTHLQAVREAVEVPLLCKDFVIDVKQIQQARSKGADAVLLIMRILELPQAQKLKQAIEDLGMLALVEVFEDEDIDKALAIDSKAILVNNRNLDSLAVNMNQTEKMLANIPAAIEVIAASGVKTPRDVKIFPPRIHSVLVGTMLMRANNPAQVIREILHD